MYHYCLCQPLQTASITPLDRSRPLAAQALEGVLPAVQSVDGHDILGEVVLGHNSQVAATQHRSDYHVYCRSGCLALNRTLGHGRRMRPVQASSRKHSGALPHSGRHAGSRRAAGWEGRCGRQEQPGLACCSLVVLSLCVGDAGHPENRTSFAQPAPARRAQAACPG